MRRYLLTSSVVLFIIALLVLVTGAALAQSAPADVTGARAVTARLLSDAMVHQTRPLPPSLEEAVTAEFAAQAWKETFTSGTSGVTTATVQELPVPPSDEVALGDVLSLFSRAVNSKSWPLLACALVLGLVWCVRRFGATWAPWFRSDAAGIILALITAAALELAAALAAGTPFSLSLLLGVLLTAAGASGFFSWTKARSGKPTVSAPAPH